MAVTTLAHCDEPGEAHFRKFQKFEYTDREKAMEQLIVSAKSGYPAACSRVANLVDGENFPHELFGQSKVDAKTNLLRSAYTRHDSSSTWALGSHLLSIGIEAEGLKLLRDACYYYLQVAWFDYARHFANRNSTPVELEEAYFFTVALCRNVDPRSPGGEEVWKLRRTLAGKISTPPLQRRIHAAVDSWLSKVGEGLHSGISALNKEAKTKALAKEEEFRNALDP